ncbi:MAG: hypothetical protein M1404_01650 [Acidobacteria bacterium]|nr:hypothetical protein [Acidobacteriota bacterium]
MEEVGIKVKEKRIGQRACDEKDAKGKLCLGHLKRWDTMPPEITTRLGLDGQIYRCDKCHVLYRASIQDRSSAGQKYVNRTVDLLGNAVRNHDE